MHGAERVLPRAKGCKPETRVPAACHRRGHGGPTAEADRSESSWAERSSPMAGDAKEATPADDMRLDEAVRAQIVTEELKEGKAVLSEMTS